MTYLFSNGILDEAEIQNLKDPDYSMKTFSLKYPLLTEDYKKCRDSYGYLRYWKTPLAGKYYACNDWYRDMDDKFNTWLRKKFPDITDIVDIDDEIHVGCTRMNIYVGYAWEKGKSARGDRLWTPIRDFLLHISKSVEESFMEYDLEISVKRLRSSHGAFVYNDILSKIEDSDLLVFNIANNPFFNTDMEENNVKKSSSVEFSGFNSNVLFEMGMAMGLGKFPIAMCPTCLEKKLPSDIRCYMWSFYDAKYSKKNSRLQMEMKFHDLVGLQNCIRGRLVNIANKLINGKETK